MNRPAPREPDLGTLKHGDLLRGVRAALSSLPIHFHTETTIEGIAVPDLFTLNTMLGATIESQVVAALNSMRQTWDPDKRHLSAQFVRQTQTFPDVLLRAANEQPIMGIELKGWYLLAKEGEPSFRYRVSPNACAEQDLLVVVPWALKNVLSGAPTVFQPFVKPARYAAEMRNYHWEVERAAKGDNRVFLAENVNPYPAKTDLIDDKPAHDSGNFGRVARSRIMDEFVQEALQQDLRGIPAKFWREFIKAFVENRDAERMRKTIESLRDRINKGASVEPNWADKILDIIQAEFPE